MHRLIPAALLGASLTMAATPRAQEDGAGIAAYAIVDGREIAESLTGAPGDAERGRQLYFDREATGCSGCHGSPGGPGAERNADTGGAPALGNIGARRSEGALRLWLVAPQAIDPETAMPAYYAAGQRTGPNDPRFGQPRLTAAGIEDLVAYLVRQKAAN